MAIKILTDGDTNQSVLIDDVEEMAFGPVFGEDEDPLEFLDWLNPSILKDARRLQDKLSGLVDQWRKEVLDNESEASITTTFEV